MGRLASLEYLLSLLASLREKQTVVLATGVFDVLHVEHIRFLTKAKKMGELLVVGIEPDVRVKKLKGEGRPINHEDHRLETIAALAAVDYAFILPDSLGTRTGRERLIKRLRPRIYAISANTPFQEEKRRIMEKFGGKLEIVTLYNPDLSTTKILLKQHARLAGDKNKEYYNGS